MFCILGHDEGDKALIAFSRALKRSLAYKNAVAARWGGDEFVIAGKEKDLTRDFRELLKEALSLAELPYTPRFSMGTFICTFAGTSCDEAIVHADEELYKDKEKNHQESEGFIENLKKLNI
ncbi:diguanylate cyclase domain-containing protein [Butyrivibrio sp. FCS014]|uniref:diguanylate cyclase domain-containing protein n=1 Tax=Butyrivibrio sp. FCS014 TaxID=1408304 RepID=UPI0004642C54|nr:diguanylate cyclase [Butyrivibrio sp. FCS014]